MTRKGVISFVRLATTLYAPSVLCAVINCACLGQARSLPPLADMRCHATSVTERIRNLGEPFARR